MKRIISVILTFAMFLSLISSMAAAADGRIIYSENFDNCEGVLPAGFKPMAFAKTRCWVQQEYSVTGKALYIYDDSTTEATVLYGPGFDVEPGKYYTAKAEMYVPYGTVSLYLKFYDSSDKEILSWYTAVSVTSGFTAVTTVNKAPSDAVTARVCYASGGSYMCKAYYDDVVVYEGKIEIDDSIVLDPPVQPDVVNAKIVEPSGDKLKYNAYNSQGDKMGDFSHVGFYNGEFEIPDSSNLPVAAVISPSEDPNSDDTARIQQVIYDVYNNSPDDSFKVIKLKAGRYNINKNGLFMRPGIILSGEGQGPTGTVLYAKEPVVHTVIKAYGGAQEKISDNVSITDKYVKAGSKKFTVESGKGETFKPGDTIHIHHHGTEEWSKAMGMWGVTNYAGVLTYWKDGRFNVDMNRTITEVSEDTITVDFPFFVPMENTYSVPYVYKTSEAAKWKHIGIENLRVESYYNGIPTDNNHAENGIYLSGVTDSYIRDVSTKHFRMAGIWVDKSAGRVTVKNCSNLEPVSTFEGNRRYGFRTSGYQQLVAGCYSYAGQLDYNTTGNCQGPVVFNDCVSDTGFNPSENHGFFAQGTLFDGIYFISNQYRGCIQFINRGYWGDTESHGWSAATSVAWNCLSPAIIGNKPPMTYENFIVGIFGWYDEKFASEKKKHHVETAKQYYRTSEMMEPVPENFREYENSPISGDCYIESPAAPVEPGSLYKAQLAERLTGSFKNAKPNAPILTNPRGEDLLKTHNVSIKGMFKKGAEKVTVYVDNKPYEAKLNNADYTFELILNLDDGVHKIYATQTVNGVESTKNADRFVTVNESKGNFDYLESHYEYERIHPLTNSDVIPYDQYQNSLKDIKEISSAEEFRSIASNMGGSYKLMADITLENGLSGCFSGTLDGNGHTITVGSKTAPATQGIFANAKNFIIKNLTVKGKINATAKAGAFVGDADGTATFINCKNFADISSPSDAVYVGGILGDGYDSCTAVTFKSCVNYGAIYTGESSTTIDSGGIAGVTRNAVVKNCINYGTINGKRYTGGLIGWHTNKLELSDCANFGGVFSKSYGRARGGAVGNLGSASTGYIKYFLNAGQSTNGVAGSKDDTYTTNLSVSYCVNVAATDNTMTNLRGKTTGNCYYLTGKGTDSTGASSQTASELKTLEIAGFTVPEDIYGVEYPVPDTLTLTTNNVTVTATEGGKVFPSGTIKVNYGRSVAFRVAADDGFYTDDCSYNGTVIALNSNDSYTTPEITAPSVFDAKFLKIADIDVSDWMIMYNPYITSVNDIGYYGKYGSVITFAKAEKAGPFTVTECGILVDTTNSKNDDELVYNGEGIRILPFDLKTKVLTENGGYGILIHNNRYTESKKCKVRAYAKYSNGKIGYTESAEIVFGAIN